jgi:hypothetical protein
MTSRTLQSNNWSTYSSTAKAFAKHVELAATLSVRGGKSVRNNPSKGNTPNFPRNIRKLVDWYVRTARIDIFGPHVHWYQSEIWPIGVGVGSTTRVSLTPNNIGLLA